MRANYKGFNISIHENYEEGLPQIMVIPQDLSRAVLNVMNNACYAVWNKAQTAPADYKPEVTVTVAATPPSLTISIADNGEGMNEEVRQHIFENFFTTKPVGKGTGLGMGITRDIIENKHGGTISFESVEGQGTTFTFTIPMREK
jgi:signal transduction histidine kinase